MAGHFVRWMGDRGIVADAMRMPQDVLDQARQLPDRYRGRFLLARLMLAQLMLRVYGISTLPALVTHSNGRPAFADRDLPDFSIAMPAIWSACCWPKRADAPGWIWR